MNGTGTGGEKPESNKNIISLVVMTLAGNATIGMCTLAYCLIRQVELNIALFTAFVAIINYILGVISGMLAKTSATNTTPAPNSTQSPTPVTVVNPPNDPANVEVQPTIP